MFQTGAFMFADRQSAEANAPATNTSEDNEIGGGTESRLDGAD
jgi:hypothetical protein